MNGTEVGVSGNGRVAPSKAQEGGPSVATGPQKLFNHPVLPELLHRTWKAASVGTDGGAVWPWGLRGWGACLHRGPGLFLVAQSNPQSPHVSLVEKSRER